MEESGIRIFDDEIRRYLRDLKTTRAAKPSPPAPSLNPEAARFADDVRVPNSRSLNYHRSFAGFLTFKATASLSLPATHAVAARPFTFNMADVKKPVSVPELRKSEDVKPLKKTPIRYPFWFGGSASCFATFFTHPLDLGKLCTALCAALDSG